MLVTLRRTRDGKPMGERDTLQHKGVHWYIASWDAFAETVLLRSHQREGSGTSREFALSEVGLYIGGPLPPQPERIPPTAREVAKLRDGEDKQRGLTVEVVAQAYLNARERVAGYSDSMLRSILLNGINDFMLQIIKLAEPGSPAAEVLIDVLDKKPVRGGPDGKAS